MKITFLFISVLFYSVLTTEAQAQTQSQTLTKAILKNNVSEAETLLTSGVSSNTIIEVVPGFATTYLITAATNGSLDLVKLLLKHKAAVNQPDAFKGTALMAAVGKGNKAIVELLLSNGAEAKAKDDDGKDALALAKEGGNKEIIALLEQKLK